MPLGVVPYWPTAAARYLLWLVWGVAVLYPHERAKDKPYGCLEGDPGNSPLPLIPRVSSEFVRSVRIIFFTQQNMPRDGCRLLYIVFVVLAEGTKKGV